MLGAQRCGQGVGRDRVVAAADDAVDIVHGKARIGQGLQRRLGRQGQDAAPGILGEGGLADADHGALVAAREGHFVVDQGHDTGSLPNTAAVCSPSFGAARRWTSQNEEKR